MSQTAPNAPTIPLALPASGYYMTSNKTCLSCGLGCNVCAGTSNQSNPTTCCQCDGKWGWILNTTSGTCYICSPGYYLSEINETCLSCGLGCTNCSGDPYSSYNGSCYNCSAGYWLNAATVNCSACSAGCASCSNGNTCAGCNSGFYFTNTSTCSD